MKALIFFSILITFSGFARGQQCVELERFKAPNATQAVAVDKAHVYVISNSQIVKYRKSDHAEVKSWKGTTKHLNSGIIIDNKLYCINSNYPEVPMASSIEVFDPKTLEHIESRSLGIYIGSATWIDRYRDHWYLMFAHYENEAAEPGRDVSWTNLVQFDKQWNRTAGWILPKELVEKIRPMSVSGGSFTPDGLLYLTPHHDEEIYVTRIPKMGYTLEWVGTIPVPFQGQGMAWDRSEPGVLYGIHRQNREVIKVRIQP